MKCLHFSLVNNDNTVGAVGFLTRIAGDFYPVCLIRVDEATGEPMRDRNGMCIRCKPGLSQLFFPDEEKNRKVFEGVPPFSPAILLSTGCADIKQ